MAAACMDCPEGSKRPIDPRSTPRRPRCATHFRASEKATRAKRHAAYVQKTYRLSDGDYDALYELQGGKCAIPKCRATGKVRRLAVDHDHDTDEVRGLLCGPHNFELLGKYAGDLHDAIAYLADPPMARLRRTR